jgi:DNA-directed RNA polymerase subunit K/omega
VTLKNEAGGDVADMPVKKEEILDRAKSAYEAVVAIAKEARRLNAAPGVYLNSEDKPIPRAVRNFVEGRVEYEIEDEAGRDGVSRRKGKKRV